MEDLKTKRWDSTLFLYPIKFKNRESCVPKTERLGEKLNETNFTK